MVSKDLSLRRKLRVRLKKKMTKDCVFRFKMMEQSESLNNASKVLNKLITRSYERKFFFTNLKFDSCQKRWRKRRKTLKSWKIKFQPRKDPKNLTSKNDLKTPVISPQSKFIGVLCTFSIRMNSAVWERFFFPSGSSANPTPARAPARVFFCVNFVWLLS